MRNAQDTPTHCAFEYVSRTCKNSDTLFLRSCIIVRDLSVDIFTDIRKVLFHLPVRIAQNPAALCPKVIVAYLIFFPLCILTMLHAVHFNHCLRSSNIEIHNIRSNYFLTVNCLRQLLKKVIPKMFLLRCHILAKRLRHGCQLWIMSFVHRKLLLTDAAEHIGLPCFYYCKPL